MKKVIDKRIRDAIAKSQRMKIYPISDELENEKLYRKFHYNDEDSFYKRIIIDSISKLAKSSDDTVLFFNGETDKFYAHSYLDDYMMAGSLVVNFYDKDNNLLLNSYSSEKERNTSEKLMMNIAHFLNDDACSRLNVKAEYDVTEFIVNDALREFLLSEEPVPDYRPAVFVIYTDKFPHFAKRYEFNVDKKLSRFVDENKCRYQIAGSENNKHLELKAKYMF
jgi:hypothetical protein